MIYIHGLSWSPQEIIKICNHNYHRLRLRDGKAEIQTLADEFRICLSSPMSYIDCSSAKKFGLFHSGDNSARIGLHTSHFELNIFLLVVLPEAFQWFTSGSPLPSVSLVRHLNIRATFVLLSYSTSFPGDMLFSLGLKLPSAINIKNLPSEKSSFLRSLWGLEFLRRPCYIWPPLFFTTPLCAPAWVCFQHQSDLVFCANPFILIVCPYCCMPRIEWPGGNGTSLLLPPLGGFRFHVLDLRWWRDENACYTQRLSSLTFNGSPADGGPQPSYLLVSHPRKTQTSTSQESASWGTESLCVWRETCASW